MKEVSQISRVGINLPKSRGDILGAGINIPQLLIGLIALILGTLFYSFFRPAEQTYFLRFLATNPKSYSFLSPVLAPLVNSLPTFIHVLAFSLMTAGFVAKRKKGYAVVCLAWFAVDALFELGQGFGERLVAYIPAWFSNVLFLENTRDYFLQGRFDYLDLFSIVAGATVAYILLVKTTNHKEGAT